MRVLILAQGSRGDVQPFAALARELKGAGHDVTFGGPETSIQLAAPHSSGLIPFDDVAKKLVADPAIRAALEANRGGIRGRLLAVRTRRRFRSMMAGTLDDLARAAAVDADIVVHHPLLPGQEIAERLGVPAVPVCLVPAFVRTSSFRSPLLPFRVPATFNRLSYLCTVAMLRPIGRGAQRRWRRDTLGLPGRRGHRDPFRRPDGRPAIALQPVSRHVLPAPLDYPNWLHTTGYWFLPAESDWTPPAGLAEFLSAGEPPIYVGFGSMSGTDPERTGRVVTEALRSAKVRAVVATGWGGIRVDDTDPNVFTVAHVPHDWLFPRTAAVVHHGGAGTTGAALAAGRPQLVCPFLTDQHFWGDCVHSAGVAPAPLPQHRFTPGGLAEAIRRAMSDRALAARAEALGREVRSEDGLAAAVRILEALA
jgi:sterol 3beta-glucosyltransferase